MAYFGGTLPETAELAPGIRRLLAPNPSMMTGPGTNTYLVGGGAIAVIDPGPNIAAHVERIVAEAAAPIRWILATHTHPDHSPGVAKLARMTGATVYGMPAPEGQHQDATFVPDIVLGDGDRVESDEFVIEALHTPGHASNHLCFRDKANNWIFTGDHVVNGSTVVIDPPDGDMRAYLTSLKRVREEGPSALAPGHGGLIENPAAVIDGIIEHRLKREGKVLQAVTDNPGLTPHELVPHVYQDVPEHLYTLAERSLLAHLLKLEADGLVDTGDDRWSLARRGE